MFIPQEFTPRPHKGISQQNLEEHLGLYKGYVKNTNMILEAIASGKESGYALAEMQRRFSFEFNGMRNHEYYFADIQNGPSELSEGQLKTAIENQFGSFNAWKERFATIAKTRGVGWAILGYDKATGNLLNYWVDEQHMGHLNSVHYVVGIDMWEHAFVADYQPSGKATYIADYLDVLDWNTIEQRFSEIA